MINAAPTIVATVGMSWKISICQPIANTICR
jgi:hypothetical protein